ncbi:hypothetical protein TSOC_015420, partial [Tetrabaena socialis]
PTDVSLEGMICVFCKGALVPPAQPAGPGGREAEHEAAEEAAAAGPPAKRARVSQARAPTLTAGFGGAPAGAGSGSASAAPRPRDALELLEGVAGVPASMFCPLAHRIMQDPVKDSRGYSWERTAIEAYLRHHHTHPIT